MENLVAKVAYIKGLAEGLDIKEKTPEAKLLLKLIDVVDDIAQELDLLIDAHDELEEKVDEIDEDLADVEDFIYDDDDEDYDDEDDFFDDLDDLDDDEFFELECPKCGEDVLIDFDALDDEKGIVCPNCHEEIVLEFNDEDLDKED